MNDIRDIKGIESVFYSWQEIAAVLIIIVLFIAMIIALIFFIKKRKKKEKPKIIEPAHVIALRALEDLNKEGLLGKKLYKKYFFRQTEIFKMYLEMHFRIDALEKTTEEFKQEIMHAHELNGHVDNIITFLSDTDLIKFSTFLPDENKIVKLSEYPKELIDKTRIISEPLTSKP